VRDGGWGGAALWRSISAPPAQGRDGGVRHSARTELVSVPRWPQLLLTSLAALFDGELRERYDDPMHCGATA
jgi:hypothetical protein